MGNFYSVCSSSIKVERTLLPEASSPDNFPTSLGYLEDYSERVENGAPHHLHELLAAEILTVLEESPMNPYSIRDIAAFIGTWGCERKYILLQYGILRQVLQQIDSLTSHSAVTSHRSRLEDEASIADDFMATAPQAAGTGYGTGSIQSKWNLRKAVEAGRQREANLIACLRVIRAYLGILPVDNQDLTKPDQLLFEVLSQSKSHITVDVVRRLTNSCLLRWFHSCLINESALDISEHIELYTEIMRVCASIAVYPVLTSLLLRPIENENQPTMLAETLHNFCLHLTGDLSNTLTQHLLGGENDRFSVFAQRLNSWIMIIETALMYYSDFDVSVVGQRQSINDDHSPQTNDSAESRYIAALREHQLQFRRLIGADGLFVVPFRYSTESLNLQSNTTRMSRIAKEIAALRTSLPLSLSSSIFVALDESRADALKVLITGPMDTPYEDGCFEFDVFFPKTYPKSPPKITLTTTGGGRVRFNPNLYNDGRVCLSILNTWEGRPEERWNATFSVLQVLVSIQALIFVSDPYFNEPGFEKLLGTVQAKRESDDYNIRVRIATLKFGLLAPLTNPPHYFEEIIHKHFWLKRTQILLSTSSWLRSVAQHRNSMTYSGTLPGSVLDAPESSRSVAEDLLMNAKRACDSVAKELRELSDPFNAAHGAFQC